MAESTDRMVYMRLVDTIGPTQDVLNRWYGPPMSFRGIDATLLAALDALLREKSVTRAARRLRVGKHALNRSLARLRAHFEDELLVPDGRRAYVLTDKAERLSTVVANATRSLAQALGRQASYPKLELRSLRASHQLFSLRPPARVKRSSSNGA